MKQLTETLTKENFWNEMMETYPKAMKQFCQWIDDYKKAVGWDKLFNDHYSQSNIQKVSNGEISRIDFSIPQPIKQVILVIVGVIAIIYLLGIVFGYSGEHYIHLR